MGCIHTKEDYRSTTRLIGILCKKALYLGTEKNITQGYHELEYSKSLEKLNKYSKL